MYDSACFRQGYYAVLHSFETELKLFFSRGAISKFLGGGKYSTKDPILPGLTQIPLANLKKSF